MPKTKGIRVWSALLPASLLLGCVSGELDGAETFGEGISGWDGGEGEGEDEAGEPEDPAEGDESGGPDEGGEAGDPDEGGEEMPEPDPPPPPLVGSNADDLLHGGQADDVIQGLAGVDELHGGEGSDLIEGGADLDILLGEGGDDTLLGGPGDDVLDGGLGDDVLEGGAGDDSYVYARGQGNEVIHDLEGDRDRLVLLDYDASEAQLSQDGDDLVIALPDGELRVVSHYAGAAIEELRFEPGDAELFASLDYGIYWFGSGGSSAKQLPGQLNPHFDPEAPTLIFTHGWSSGSVADGYRDDFDWGEVDGPEAYLAQHWIDQGWNVGIFHWQQFADEGEVKDAEAKIWTAAGPRAMRWQSADGVYHEGETLGLSVSELFARELRETAAWLRSGELRLAGHSLGNQLVTTTADQLWAQVDAGLSPRLMPGRVALLDGFWSKGDKDYLGGQWTGERARDLVDALAARGVVIEAYRSSGVGSNPFIGDANDELLAKTCFVELRPWYFGPLSFAAKHTAAAWHYMWAMQVPAPSDGQGATVCSSSASDDAVNLGMIADFHWRHEDGVYSKTPADDGYVRVD